VDLNEIIHNVHKRPCKKIQYCFLCSRVGLFLGVLNCQINGLPIPVPHDPISKCGTWAGSPAVTVGLSYELSDARWRLNFKWLIPRWQKLWLKPHNSSSEFRIYPTTPYYRGHAQLSFPADLDPNPREIYPHIWGLTGILGHRQMERQAYLRA